MHAAGRRVDGKRSSPVLGLAQDARIRPEGVIMVERREADEVAEIVGRA